jgi:hypothetical protein
MSTQYYLVRSAITGRWRHRGHQATVRLAVDGAGQEQEDPHHPDCPHVRLPQTSVRPLP